MFKKSMIASGVAIAVAALPVMAEEGESPFADFTVSGTLKNETAVFTKGGTTIGSMTRESNGQTYDDTVHPHDNGDVMKSETSARLFINGPVGESSELHAELRPVRDGEAVDGMKGHEDYTQQDWLRELYVDTTAGEEESVYLRLGKQQVVWGTADGMKLLDIINPTDYREMAQNSMDESRIPVWMINAETDLEDGSNLQVVISQPKENVFAGLNRGISTVVRANSQTTFADQTSGGQNTGQPFVMKGVDSITGATNGFLNVAPDLGGVAGRFAGGFGHISELSSPKMAGFTVSAFEGMTMGGGTTNTQNGYNMAFAMSGNGMLCTTDDNCNVSSSVTNDDYDTVDGLSYKDLPDNFQQAVINVANALNGGASTDAQRNAVTGQEMLAYGFGSLYNTTLADMDSIDDTAFDYMGNTTFLTFDAFVNARSQYAYNMPDDADVDLAVRLKRSLDSGLNYSLNYSYNYDKNPIINLSWRNDAGEKLHAIRVNPNGTYTGVVVNPAGGSLVLNSKADNTGTAYGGLSGNSAILTFEQEVKRAHNLGSALDYAMDTKSLGPVVLRGEFLYQKDVYQPVMDKDLLGIGDLVGALQMEKTNRFKYVLGADITVLTNMMVSAQFIQDRNLDHVDNGNRYTADYATMHMTNGFNKAEKNKEFYSLFFSKPFGAEQQHRWNNIFMFEENGGKWNRFDVEYSFNDELIGTAEYNKYWGDENTQFGQLEASSNFQLGLKYLF